MSNVQAKVRCIGNATSPYDPENTKIRLVRFTPVYDADPSSPNHEWSEATPSGYIELYISNPAAFQAFEMGKDYLLTFEPQQ